MYYAAAFNAGLATANLIYGNVLGFLLNTIIAVLAVYLAPTDPDKEEG